jgi:hypothetical protein
MKLLPIANLNPYLLFLYLYLFQQAKGSTSIVTPVQTCFKVTNLTPSLFSIANDLNPYLLFLVLLSAGQRVNIWSHLCSDLLQGNKLNTLFVSDCEWSQLLPLVLVLVLAGQRVNVCSRFCSHPLQGNKLNTFVCLVRINYKVLCPNMTWDPLLLDGSYQVNDASSQTN